MWNVIFREARPLFTTVVSLIAFVVVVNLAALVPNYKDLYEGDEARVKTSHSTPARASAAESCRT